MNEEGPGSLGGPFDLVTSSNALHACTNVPASLQHISNLLVDDGFLLFYEYTVQALYSHHIDCVLRKCRM